MKNIDLEASESGVIHLVTFKLRITKVSPHIAARSGMVNASTVDVPFSFKIRAASVSLLITSVANKVKDITYVHLAGMAEPNPMPSFVFDLTIDGTLFSDYLSDVPTSQDNNVLGDNPQSNLLESPPVK